jgi:hypothetical protein
MLLVLAAVALLSNVAHAVEFFSPDWVIPLSIGTPYDSMTVNPGDSLTFSWSQGTHDVWIYPSGSCDPTDGIRVGTTSDNPSTYVFSEAEAGTTITFACDVGAHCQAGMRMDVNVLGVAPAVVTRAPTIAPVPVTETPIVAPELDIVDNQSEQIVAEQIVPEITGDFGACNVCGTADGQVTESDFVVSLPNPGRAPIEVYCADLFRDGMNGLIPEPSCAFISQRVFDPCGCVAPDFTCNICGEDDYVVRSPDTIVAFPEDPTESTSCSGLAEAGLNGELSPTQCGAAALFAYVPCQCSPANLTCSICGKGFKTSNRDIEIDLGDIPGGLTGTTTCGDLEEFGANGLLTPAQCIAAESLNRFSNTCECVPVEPYPECNICGDDGSMPMSPDLEIAIASVDVMTCQAAFDAGKNGMLSPGECFEAQGEAVLGCNCGPADYTCNVCGGDGTDVAMLNPENNFTVPLNGALVNCGILDAAGIDGIVTPADCAIISPLVQTECGCTPVDFACNICGQGSGMTISEGDVTFIPGEDIICAEAQASALAGGIEPLRCGAITPFAQISCGCQEGGTPMLVVDEIPVDATETNGSSDAPVASVPEVDTETVATDTPVISSIPEDVEVGDADATDSGSVSDSESGTVTGLEGSGSTSSESGSQAVSSTMAMALSCFLGMIVALLA